MVSSWPEWREWHEESLTLSLLLEDELSLLIVVLVLPSPAVLSSLFSVGRQRVTGVSAGSRRETLAHPRNPFPY